MLYEEETGKPYGELIEKVIGIMATAQAVEESGGTSMSGMSITPIVDAAYFGLKAAALVNGEDFDLRRIQVASMIGSSLDTMRDIITGFVEGIPRNTDAEDAPSESAKKKVTAKHRNRIG